MVAINSSIYLFLLSKNASILAMIFIIALTVRFFSGQRFSALHLLRGCGI